MDKLNLCVVFGGMSTEHDISRISVTSILNKLNKEKYNIIVMGITKQGEWKLYTGDYAKIQNGDWEKDTANIKHAIISPDTADKGIFVFEDDKATKINVDVVFPVLHGAYGEDGTLQGLLELAGIKYVGMGVLSSAVSLDKVYTNMICDYVNVPQAKWTYVTKAELDDMASSVEKIETKLGYPCFVKPSNAGSSIGINKAHNRQELIDALKYAAQFDRKIVVEENIDGKEVECAILGNYNDVKASEIGRIIPKVEFYDFEAKYEDDSTELMIPADVTDIERKTIQENAIKIFKALDGTGLSRADFFVRHSDGAVLFNEINTLPGFTSISMYPKLWEVSGIEYSALLDELIGLAQQRVK